MERNLREAVVVACGRSAIGKGGKGSLRSVHPVDLAGQVLAKVLERVPELAPEQVEDVVLGCSKPQSYQGDNIGRLAALRAGLPHGVPGMTVNRFCASSLQALSIAANSIRVGEASIVAAGGVESMSLLPMGSDPAVPSQWIEAHQPGVALSMGETAELVAKDFHITRAEADAFSAESHRRAALARANGLFREEIVPISVPEEDGSLRLFDQDEGIRPTTTPEILAGLKPVFGDGGQVTAGNASQVSDGAAMVLLMERERAEAAGVRPMARVLGFSAVGVDPSRMGIGPIHAVPKLLAQAGLRVEDLDVVELNEAFAAQAIPCIRTLGLDPRRVNPNGGAIAMGHPLGATGAILTTKLCYQLQRTGGRYGMVCMCVGGGMGAAALFERL